jgi:hypothetical protein
MPLGEQLLGPVSRRRKRRWLCLPMTALCLLDIALTLQGQKPEYWAGNYVEALEANPIAKWFMVRGPLAFGGLSIAWLGFINVMVMRLPRFLAAAFSFVVCFAHCVCAATWLYRFDWPGWIAIVVLLIATERLLTYSWRRAGLRGKKD